MISYDPFFFIDPRGAVPTCSPGTGGSEAHGWEGVECEISQDAGIFFFFFSRQGVTSPASCLPSPAPTGPLRERKKNPPARGLRYGSEQKRPKHSPSDLIYSPYAGSAFRKLVDILSS